MKWYFAWQRCDIFATKSVYWLHMVIKSSARQRKVPLVA
jgi:hypothetical protein